MRALFLGIIAIGLLNAGPITVIDLGGFGGTNSVGYRVNDAGLVVGWAQTAANDSHAFSSSGSAALDLNSQASESFAYGVNSSGAVAGVSYESGQSHGTVWNHGQVTDLGAGTAAMDINASGQVVGSNGHAFVYSSGRMVDLGVLFAGGWSSANAINASGVVAGYGSVPGNAFRGFIWSAGSGIQAVGTLGGNSSYATAINDSGQVVGHANLASGYEHAFLTTGGALTDLGTLGGASSYAYGINNSGAIVGYSWLAGSSDQHAFLYYNGHMSDLNGLIPANSGWVLQQAYGINSAGDIVGSGTFNGQTHAFLIDPIPFADTSGLTTPEPGTIGLLTAGLMLLGLLRKVRR